MPRQVPGGRIPADFGTEPQKSLAEVQALSPSRQSFYRAQVMRGSVYGLSREAAVWLVAQTTISAPTSQDDTPHMQ